MKILTIILGLIIVLLIGAWFLVAFGTVGFLASNSDITNPDTNTSPAINSFEGCVEAGNPIMESYPRQCKTAEGQTFSEKLKVFPTYYNADPNVIKLGLPYPGSTTSKDFQIYGGARGSWFFEASFPVEVLDENGEVLVSTHATAQGDWMTTDFVTYTADILVPESYSGPATIVLKKDNPSGLPENEASMSVPITIE